MAPLLGLGLGPGSDVGSSISSTSPTSVFGVSEYGAAVDATGVQALLRVWMDCITVLEEAPIGGDAHTTAGAHRLWRRDRFAFQGDNDAEKSRSVNTGSRNWDDRSVGGGISGLATALTRVVVRMHGAVSSNDWSLLVGSLWHPLELTLVKLENSLSHPCLAQCLRLIPQSMMEDAG